MKNKSWNQYFFEMCDLVASKSKDPSTKVGAVIVGEDNEIRSTGFNGFSRHVDETIPERWERPIKYQFVSHAERNAIYNAARIGVSLKGCTLYMNFEPCPCTGCANAVIQSGIEKIVGPAIPFPGKGEQWENDMKISKVMLDEAGVERIEIEDEWVIQKRVASNWNKRNKPT